MFRERTAVWPCASCRTLSRGFDIAPRLLLDGIDNCTAPEAMAEKDPGIDAYIASAAPFAQKILKHLRKLVHCGCSEVEETIKWSNAALSASRNVVLDGGL